MKRKFTAYTLAVILVLSVCVVAAAVGTRDGAVDDLSHIQTSRTAAQTAGDTASREVSRTTPHSDNEYEVTDYSALLAAVQGNRVFDGEVVASAELIEEVCVTLLDMAEDGEQSLIIKQDTVNDYIHDLYGITIDPSVLHYDGLEAPEGYYPILPHGYAVIEHSITGTHRLADGTLKVSTVMTVTYSDDDVQTLHAETVLAKNADSRFGYNIVSAVICEDNAA